MGLGFEFFNFHHSKVFSLSLIEELPNPPCLPSATVFGCLILIGGGDWSLGWKVRFRYFVWYI